MNNSTYSCWSEEHLEVIGIIEAVSSFISILSCLLVIVIIVAYKKYLFTMQRLLLYITISVLLDAISNCIMGGSYSIIYSSSKYYCIMLGFLVQYFASCILFSVVCMIIELLLRTVCQRESGRIEWIYIPVIFLLPATTSWIPFIHEAYGPVRGFCTIQTVNPEDCSSNKYGLILMSVLWWLPLYLTVFFGSIAYVVILYKLHKAKKQYTPLIEVNRKVIYKEIIQDVSYYKWYPILFAFINLIPIVNEIVDFLKPNSHILGLWIIATLVKGLQGGFIAIAIALDPKTRKRLRLKHLRAACLQNVFCQEVSEEYPVLSEVTDSLTLTKEYSTNIKET